MGYPANKEKNKAIVLLKKAGMSMNGIVRTFGETDKRNFYRVWYRDKGRYNLPKSWCKNRDKYDLVVFVKKQLKTVIKRYKRDDNKNKQASSSPTTSEQKV